MIDTNHITTLQGRAAQLLAQLDLVRLQPGQGAHADRLARELESTRFEIERVSAISA